jgi:hypothetical protein
MLPTNKREEGKAEAIKTKERKNKKILSLTM